MKPAERALLALLEPRTLDDLAKQLDLRPSATKLLLGALVLEGRVVPDGRGGYVLHPRERYRQESKRKALESHAARQSGPRQEVHVRTQNMSGERAPSYRDTYDEYGQHGGDE